MGRRPKAIVTEFFHREDQTRDTSNRYDHTCRQCGKLFVRGRVETLLNHLLKKCPNIGHNDRKRIKAATEGEDSGTGPTSVATDINVTGVSGNGTAVIIAPELDTTVQLQRESPSIPKHVTTAPHTEPGRPAVTDAEGEKAALPSLARTQSALDTLAEASTHHLGHSSTPATHDEGRSTENIGKEDDVDHESFIAQLTAASQTPSALTGSTRDATTHLAQFRPLSPPPSLVAYTVPSPAELPPPDWDGQNYEAMVTSALTGAPSVQGTNAGRKRKRDEVEGTTYGPDGEPVARPEEAPSTPPTQPPAPAQLPNGHSFHIIEPTMYQPDGTVEGPAKSTARTRFSDARRQEVSKVRKQGACIRCRMLKKPCSEGTPCTTCQGVESARLWRAPCLRTKLNELFKLWSAGLFCVRMQKDISVAIHGLQPENVQGCVEVRLIPGTDQCMAFNVTRFAPALVSYRAALTETTNASQHTPQDIVLLAEGELLHSKLQAYMASITDACISNERESFMRVTLQQAQKMVLVDAVRGGDGVQSEGARSCYTVHNELLREVISLWVATKFLTFQHHQAESTIRYNPSTMAPRQSILVPAEAESTLSTQSEKLILAQILATTEGQCARLSKIVMNELERRLLQRQQVSRFTTFITAVILFNCIERMTGLFRTFDQTPAVSENTSTEEPTAPEASTPETTNSQAQPDKPKDWPLEDPPSKFWPQGEQFSNLLIMLLRMRALLPPIKASDEGLLMLDSLDKKKIKDQGEEQRALTAQWLNSIRSSTGDLVRLRDSPLPGKGDGMEAWNLKFVLRALLPLDFEAKETPSTGKTGADVPETMTTTTAATEGITA